MSAAILCDSCNTMLRIDQRGDDEYGERAAWIRLTIADQEYEACTTTCAHALLNRDDILEALADYLAAISEIARTIRDG